MSNETSERPWGGYEVLADATDHKVKRIIVNPGKRLSLQSHRMRDEHWFIVKGQGLVTRDDEQIKVRKGQTVEIPRGAKHRIKNTGRSKLVFIEVQTGQYFGEDDIKRYEDDFGRA
jgi:mannose-6-phosphate isomerase